MWQALLNLAASRPQLLAGHAEAYAELVGVQLGEVSASWRRRLLLDAAALCALCAAAVLGGMSVLLWAALPTVSLPGLLIGVPLLPLAAAIVCVAASRRAGALATFEPVLRQLRADLEMLRETAES